MSKSSDQATRRRSATLSILIAVVLTAIQANWNLLEQAMVASTSYLIAEEESLAAIWKQSPTTDESGSVILRTQVGTKHSWENNTQHSSPLASVQNATIDPKVLGAPQNTSASMPNHTRYYFLHIPKAGGNSLRNKLSHNGACVIDHGPRAHVGKFSNWTYTHPYHRVFMTEGLGFNHGPRPEHNFAIFRSPQPHVLSQFFHCTESKPHRRKAQFMPSTLLEWLQAWENVRQSTSLKKQKGTGKAPSFHWKDQRFQCYNPINLQSWITGYPTTQEQLTESFDAVGVLSEFYLTSCVFSTMALERVPPTCNCVLYNQTQVTKSKSKRNSASNDMSASMMNGTEKLHSGADHGVTHHGDSFQPSELEKELIRNLTQYDQVLYDNAAEILYRKVADLELQYQTKLCRAPPKMPKKEARQRPCKKGPKANQ